MCTCYRPSWLAHRTLLPHLCLHIGKVLSPAPTVLSIPAYGRDCNSVRTLDTSHMMGHPFQLDLGQARSWSPLTLHKQNVEPSRPLSVHQGISIVQPGHPTDPANTRDHAQSDNYVWHEGSVLQLLLHFVMRLFMRIMLAQEYPQQHRGRQVK